jgi:hypothetical protein
MHGEDARVGGVGLDDHIVLVVAHANPEPRFSHVERG